jgi:lysophospholipase L1-like esterase
MTTYNQEKKMYRSMLIITLIFALTFASVSVSARKAPAFLLNSRDTVVVLGDSITADGRYTQLVQDFVDAKYPERQIRFVSAGASGDTVRGSLNRLEKQVYAWKPDWVLINLGVNDLGRFSVEEYLTNYEAMINRIYRDTKAKIGIMSFIYFDRENKDTVKEEAYIAGIQALAKKYDCLYIPCYETFKAVRPTLPTGVRYAGDAVHPNQFGYWMFAQSILKALNYPFDGKPISLDIPVTRLSAADYPDQASLIGKKFTVALPNPLKVTITKFQPNTTTVPRAAKAVNIDGKLNEWNLNNPILIDKREQQCGGVIKWGQDHHTAKAYTSYDDNAWYFAIAVDTPVVVNTATSTSIIRDSIELHVDLRSPEEKAKYGNKAPNFLANQYPHVVQYLLAPATAQSPTTWVGKGSGDADMLTGVKAASSLTNTGYIIEMSVPAALFPSGVITPDAVYGLDITVDDVDRFEDWSELTQIRWSGSQLSFFSTLEYGMMTIGK